MSNHFTVPNLLMALITVGGLTLGLFGFDAERAIGRLEAIEANQASITQNVAVVTTRVDGLSTRVDGMSGQVADHEKRITFVEAHTQPRP